MIVFEVISGFVSGVAVSGLLIYMSGDDSPGEMLRAFREWVRR